MFAQAHVIIIEFGAFKKYFGFTKITMVIKKALGGTPNFLTN